MLNRNKISRASHKIPNRKLLLGKPLHKLMLRLLHKRLPQVLTARRPQYLQHNRNRLKILRSR
jgi:hypothetical protein